MRPIYVKATKKDTLNIKERKTGTGRGCAGTTNPRGTWIPDDHLKGIRNTIPRNLDNPLEEIRDIVPKGIRSQWPIGLTVPT